LAASQADIIDRLRGEVESLTAERDKALDRAATFRNGYKDSLEQIALMEEVVEDARWLRKYLELEAERTGNPYPTLKLAKSIAALAKLEGAE
jgi:hypothetical protein